MIFVFFTRMSCPKACSVEVATHLPNRHFVQPGAANVEPWYESEHFVKVNVFLTIRKSVMKFCTGINPQRINPIDFGDPLAFPLIPSSG